MISPVMIALAFLAPPVRAPQNDLVIIASMTVHAKRLRDNDVTLAQRYASCISMPYFPLKAEFAAKRGKCRSNPALAKPSQQLTNFLDHIDGIVRENPASEASLRVSNK